MKIGTKLFISYMLVIVICFSVGFTVFGLLSRQYMLSQAREDLKQQGEALAKVISLQAPEPGAVINNELQQQDSDLPPSGQDQPLVVRKQQMQLAGSLIDTRIVLINSLGKAAYTDLEPQLLEQFMIKHGQGLEMNGYIQEEFVVDNEGEEKGMTLVLLASLDELHRISRMSLRAQVYSLLAATLLALLMGWFFERTLSRPLNRLKKAMQAFSVSQPLPVLAIKTGDEVEELANCFEDMARKLKRYDERQKALLQNTSHELKTPLMSIQGYAEAIRDGVVEGAEVEESLNIIIEESQRLKNTVSDLIYLSRVENMEEEYCLEQLQICDVVAHALRTVKPLAAEKGLEMAVDAAPGLTAWIDEEKLERALINIIGNGVRYARHSIIIECGTSDSDLIISMRDDGPGFQNGEEERIFDRFYKGQSGGSGLGLAIARAIIIGHHGVLEAFNAPGGGAVFQISLPRAQGRHESHR